MQRLGVASGAVGSGFGVGNRRREITVLLIGVFSGLNAIECYTFLQQLHSLKHEQHISVAEQNTKSNSELSPFIIIFYYSRRQH